MAKAFIRVLLTFSAIALVFFADSAIYRKQAYVNAENQRTLRVNEQERAAYESERKAKSFIEQHKNKNKENIAKVEKEKIARAEAKNKASEKARDEAIKRARRAEIEKERKRQEIRNAARAALLRRMSRRSRAS